MQFLMQERTNNPAPIQYEYCYVQKNSRAEWEVLKHKKTPFKPKQYLDLQVIGDKVGDEIMFKVYCEDKEYSSLEHGEQLYQQIAQLILKRRKGNTAYPMYITDLDLSRSLLGNDSTDVQTIHYLNYKKYFENKLQFILENSA